MQKILSRKSIFAIGIACAVFSGVAGASIQWGFSGGSGATVFDPDGSPSAPSYTSDTGNVTATVSGWADTGSSGQLESQVVKVWSGLAVDINGSEGTPDHAMDNHGPDEMLLFEFSEDIVLSEVQAGYVYGDSDITILAYTGTGTPDLTNYLYSGSSSHIGPESTNTYDPADDPAGSTVGLTQDGWELVGSYSNIGTGVATVNQQGLSSSYWLVGAYNSTVDNQGWTTGNDHLKIAMVGGTVTPSQGPPTGVPIPPTLWLFLLGLPATFYLRRRA